MGQSSQMQDGDHNHMEHHHHYDRIDDIDHSASNNVVIFHDHSYDPAQATTSGHDHYLSPACYVVDCAYAVHHRPIKS